MPIKQYRPLGLSPIEEFNLAIGGNERRDNPLTPADPSRATLPPQLDALRNTPLGGTVAGDFLTLAGMSFSRDSIVGSIIGDVVPYHLGAGPSEIDAAWDVRKYNTPEWLDAHPYMTEHFLDGSADDFPNETRFLNFVARKGEDAQIRAFMGSKGFGTQLLAAIPGQAIDALTGGVVLRAVGMAGKAAQAEEWVRRGSLLSRVGKGAGVAAGLNLAQETALEALNPDRDVDEREAALWALGMGAAFGSAVPAFVAGVNKSGQTISSARVRRMQRDVAESLSSPKVGEVADMAKADAARLREMLGPERGDGADDSTTGPVPSERPLTKAAVYRALQNEVPEYILSPGAAGKRVRTSVPEILRSLARSEMESEYGAAPVSDHTRLLSLVGWLDKSGELRGHDLAGLDGAQLQPGDTWLIDGRWEMEVVDAGGDSLTIRATDHTSAIPLGDGETIGASTFDYTVPRGAVLPANAGSLYRAADADSIGVPDFAVGAASPNDPAFRFREVDAAGDDATRTMTILRTPETAPLIDALKAKHGDDVEFVEHPQQAAADWAAALQELDASLSDALPADLGPVAGRIAGVLSRGIPLAAMEIPAQRLMRSPSSLARRAGRLLFDFTWPTQSTVDSPLTNLNRVPAEGILWRLHKVRDDTILGVDAALIDGLKAGPIVYTFADGETLNISRRITGRDGFGRAVVDHLRRIEEHGRGRGAAPDAPEPIKRAAEAVRSYARAMGREAVDAGFLRELDPDRIYVPRRWRSDLIRLRRGDFKRKLIRAWEQNRVRDFETNNALDPDRRPLLPDVVEFSRRGQAPGGLGLTPADRSAIRGLLGESGEGVDKLTESLIQTQLGDDVLRRYREEVVVYFDHAADSTIDTLTGIENAHGVEHGSTNPSVFKSRVLQIDETAFADYLDSRLQGLLESYHRQTSGRIASRLAIKAAGEEWGPLVKAATGKDLASEGFNPELVVEAVRRDFQTWLDATAGDPAKQAKIESAMHATVGENGILTAKLRELEGRPRFPGNPAAEAGWRVFLERNSLKMPFMAMLGKMTVSAFTDLAAGVFYKSMTPRHVGTLAQSLNLFRQFPVGRRGLETLYVATADMVNATRAMELGDIGPRMDDRPFGPGRTGRALAAADSVTDYLARKFTAATLIGRWNTNLKRGTATIVMQELIDGAAKMVRAGRLMDDGLSEAEAVARVFGDGAHDAVRLNRLGLNVDRSRRLLAMLEKHGVDWEGNPIAGRLEEPDRGYISPEFNRWATADRELFESFTHAVNTETMNLIVEPKLLSKPLANASWVGRVFNQFQSFAFAWGNQLAPLAAQRPGYEVAGAFSLMVGLGALTDALHNELSGRRRLEDTVRLWQEKPAGMVYAAVSRAGVAGWLSRPLGLLEQTPWGIAKNLGNDQLSTFYGRPGPMIDQLGPFMSWANRVYDGTLNAMRDGGWNDRTSRQLWGAVPFRNLWAVEGFNRMAERMGLGTPIGPEPTGSGVERP